MGKREITLVKLKNREVSDLDVFPIKKSIYADLYEIFFGKRSIGYFGNAQGEPRNELTLFNACNLIIRAEVGEIDIVNIREEISTRIGVTSFIMVSQCALPTRKRLFMLSLKGQENIESTIRSKVRSQIKSTYKKGLHTSIVEFEEGLAEFHRLYVRNMRDIGSISFPKKLFARANETLDFKIFLTSLNGEYVAGAILVIENNHCEVSFAGINRKYSKYSPNMQLYAEMINYSIRNSKTYFSFGTSDFNSSQMRFKKQFGASIFYYSILTKGITHSFMAQFKGALKYYIHSQRTSMALGRIYSILMYRI